LEEIILYLSIDHNSGVPVSQQIIEQVKYLVIGGQLPPGEKLPSVRGLAAQLKINPTTVARVYRQLEAEEIIYAQAGRGAFVAQKRSVLTLTEKRRRLRGEIRRLVVESGRIGLDYSELVKLLEEEIKKINRLEEKA
jgi:GntR family transcriptional regulator